MSYFGFSDCITKSPKIMVSFCDQNNVIVGHNSNIPLTNLYKNCNIFGNNVNCTGSNQVQLGNSLANVYAPSGLQHTSDIRDKSQVRDTILGLNFINTLRPVDYKWNFRGDYINVKSEYEVVNGVNIPITEKLVNDGSKTRNRFHHGLVAQEVKQTMESLGIDFGGYQDHSINGGTDQLTISYTELIAPMIKAIQELKAEVDTLKAEVKSLQSP
jgi:hypothetical protein